MNDERLAEGRGRSVPRLRDPAVVLIDAQPGFFRSAAGVETPAATDTRWEKLLVMARCLELPTIATFEEPERNGWLSAACERVWPAHGLRYVKRTFDCCGEADITAALTEIGRTQLLVAGAETDVCVLQSVLSLLQRGHEVFLLEDCVASSEPHTRPALERMYAAGAIPCTLKTAYYELMRTVTVCRDPRSGGRGWELLMREFDEPESLVEWRPAT
jgi:nicotinamidase-related amidase